jgi:hypothetical protein
MGRLGLLTGRAARRATELDGGPRSARLAGYKRAGSKRTGAGPRRSRSGSTAAEPQLPGRLGTGTHRDPQVPDARRAVLAGIPARPAASRPGSAAGQPVPAVKRAMLGAGAGTPGRALPGTVTAPRAASGRTGRTGRPGPLRLPRVGRRRLAGGVSPATAWASWITKNRPRRRSGPEFGRALNQHVVVRRPAPAPAGRQGGRLVVGIPAVPGPTVQRPRPSQPAKCRLAVRRLPVLGRRSQRLPDPFHPSKSWKGDRATLTAVTRTGR